MDISFSPEFQLMLLASLASSFLVGFIPAFYMVIVLWDHLRRGKSLWFALPVALVAGIVAGYLSFTFLMEIDYSHNALWNFIGTYILFIAGLELLIAIIHFWKFRPRTARKK